MIVCELTNSVDCYTMDLYLSVLDLHTKVVTRADVWHHTSYCTHSIDRHACMFTALYSTQYYSIIMQEHADK